jgi:serine/threonine protein kinase
MTTVPLADLAGFRILDHVGKGGLGDVYVAERISTGGKVAIKILRDESGSGDVERRIRREVEALVALKGHPGVVQIEEVITTRKGPAVVMEYAAEGSLQTILKERGHLSAEETIVVGSQVARLLVDAHLRGIIHRDIKPHNILRTGFGQYKVCDFGIASLTRSPGWADHTSAISYRYASPEEVEGSSIGPSSDIYSLGVTLLQTRIGSTEGLRSGAAFAFANGSAVDFALAGLVRAMTQTEPSRRPDASTVMGALQRALAPRPVPTPSVSEADDDATVKRQPNARPTIVHDGLPQPTLDVKWWENQ